MCICTLTRTPLVRKKLYYSVSISTQQWETKKGHENMWKSNNTFPEHFSHMKKIVCRDFLNQLRCHCTSVSLSNQSCNPQTLLGSTTSCGKESLSLATFCFENHLPLLCCEPALKPDPGIPLLYLLSSFANAFCKSQQTLSTRSSLFLADFSKVLSDITMKHNLS